MKNISIALFAVLLLTGCQVQNQKHKKENTMTTEKNKQLVIRFNKEFFESGNTAITKELLADSFTNHTAPPNAPTNAGPMIQFITGFHKGFRIFPCRLTKS